MSEKRQNPGQTPADAAALRERAEARARNMAPTSLSAQTPEEIQRVFHELRVHQIELEMQNEELRTAQAQIEAERDRYFDFYDLAPVGYCTLSEKGLILEANLTAATLLGTNRGDLIEQPISRFILEEDPDIYCLHRRKLLETGEPRECELRLVKPDGTHFWAHLAATAAQAEDGAPVCRVVLSDITERKQAEEKLEVSERTYRKIFDAITDALFIHDIETGAILDVNDSMLTRFGYTREEIPGLTVGELSALVEPYTNDRAGELIRRAECGETVVFEWLNKRKDGELFYSENILKFVMIAGTERIMAIVRDITERKQAEEALIRQQRSIHLYNRIANVFLTSSRDEVFADVLDVLLKALGSRFGYFGYIDEAGDMVCPSMTCDVWDRCQVAEKSVVFPRAVWGGLWGRSLLEKRTLIANENLRIPEGHVALENALAAPIVYNDDLIGQFVVANKAGGYDKDDRDLLESAAAQTAPILFAIREEARRKTAQEKLEEQLRQAQKMESVGRLAGGVAHDFNNMLSIIIGSTEMAMEDMAPDDPLQDNLDEISSAARRSADITRQLLAFARKQTIAPKVLDLNDTIENMLKMLRRLIGEDIDLTWLPETKIWPVRMDPSQIDQILANLCVNARDAIADVGKITMETGNATFDSAYCADHPGFVAGDFVLLAVGDDGCGMDQETLANLFEPFFTTKEVGKGTGLGLATVYGIVKQNGGFINVHSEPDQGTTFRIHLPRYRAETGSPEKKTSDKTDPAGTETILLVEDEPSILQMVRMMLERNGYKVLAAGTPGEAIELAREHAGEIHLLMTDVIMPEMNGRDLAGNLLSLYPNLKRLFMSGYTADVIAHHGVLDEGVQFIQKPFARQALSIKVREALDEDNP